MRKNAGAMGCAMMAIASLYGCGAGGGSPPTGTATPPPITTTPTPTPSPSPTAPPVASALTQADARIGECINLGNHLEPPNEGDWGRALNDSDMAEIAARGFKTVRLPVRWSNHASVTAPYTIDAAFMARVVQVVDQAKAANLRVILNVHHYDDSQGNIFADPAGQSARFAGLWAQIADRFKGYDNAQLWFELLNEPHDRLNHGNLLSVLEPALAQVRATNPTRPVLIGGENYSGVNSLSGLPLPNDPYLIATFHYYDPFNFTHQGAPWITPVMPTGVTYGSSGDAAALNTDVQKVRDYMARTGRPVVLGEYGAYEQIPLGERVDYYKAVHDGFKAAQVDGCVWAYTNTMHFRDPATGNWVTQLLGAIGL